MSLHDSGSKVAVGAIDALKTSPILLALVIMQIATLTMLYFGVQFNQDRMQEREMLLINRCFAERAELRSDKTNTSSIIKENVTEEPK